MKGGFFIFLSLLFLFSCNSFETEKLPAGADAISIVPLPASIRYTSENFLLSGSTRISTTGDDKELLQLAADLAVEIKRTVNIPIPSSASLFPKNTNVIELEIDASFKMPGAYSLRIDEDRVLIKGKDPQALFYGIQTFLQLLYPQQPGAAEVYIPGVEILDEPLFSWRGMHMDVSRHFFSKEFVKRTIDRMAMHKMNVFHWHLTDDQGWRIEIKKYPELTRTGAWRKETVVGHMADDPYRFDGKKYGGYYTQEDIREIVDYARSKYITIVPEIEMPGHATAALSAYPEYSCTGGPFEVFSKWGITEDVYCAGKEKTFEFLENILSEVLDLFPGEYIHVGGDECIKLRWKSCADCQKRIKTEGLKDEMELQNYFSQRIEKYLAGKGKKLIGWDEILEGKGLPERAAVMSWRGTSGGIQAAKAGHDVVMSPTSYCYFDHYQGLENEPLAIAGYKSLEKVYSFNPVPDALNKQEAKHILGAQANIWTEYITTEEHYEYMAFPRACAMAEILWTPREKQNYEHFLKRMDAHYRRLDKEEVNYRVPAPRGFDADTKFFEDTARVTLYCEVPSAEIHYTLDGSEPTKSSTRFDSPFMLSLETGKTLKAKVFLPGGRSSATKTGRFEQASKLQSLNISGAKPGIAYKYHDKKFSSAKNIAGTPAVSGVVTKFLLPLALTKEKEWFGMEYDGYINIEKDDLYTFYLNSDDGALLYVDNILLVDNDGYHYGQEKAGMIGLEKGFHSIRVLYFQGKFGTELDVKIKTAETEKQEVPEKMLWH